MKYKMVGTYGDMYQLIRMIKTLSRLKFCSMTSNGLFYRGGHWKKDKYLAEFHMEE